MLLSTAPREEDHQEKVFKNTKICNFSKILVHAFLVGLYNTGNLIKFSSTSKEGRDSKKNYCDRYEIHREFFFGSYSKS